MTTSNDGLGPLPKGKVTHFELGTPVGYTAEQMRAYAAAAVAAERERWKTMMRRAIATCFEQRARHEVMSDPQHFAAEALKD